MSAVPPNKPPRAPKLSSIEIDEEEYKTITRRRLLGFGVLMATAAAGLRAISNSDLDRGLPWPLRQGMDTADAFWKSQHDTKRLAPSTPETTIPLRINGNYGLEKEIAIADWRLSVADPELLEPLSLSLDAIRKLPSVTENFEFKCIEGWSQNTTCTGVRFRDFMSAFNVGTRSSRNMSNPKRIPYSYAMLTSVNGGYYVSMDAKSLQHPQTLLCYEMNGKPLDAAHGYPLRLMTAVKYGVKSIKQIGSISFSDSPPADFWAERGYGDHLGL